MDRNTTSSLKATDISVDDLCKSTPTALPTMLPEKPVVDYSDEDRGTPSEAPSHDYTTLSETEHEGAYKSWETMFQGRAHQDRITVHDCSQCGGDMYDIVPSESSQHTSPFPDRVRLAQYALELRKMTADAIRKLMLAGEGDTSSRYYRPPFSRTWRERIEGELNTNAASPSGGLKIDSSGSSDLSSAERSTPTIDRNESPLTQSSIYNQQGPDIPVKPRVWTGTLRRTNQSYYFLRFEHLRDVNGDALIETRARVFRDV